MFNKIVNNKQKLNEISKKKVPPPRPPPPDLSKIRSNHVKQTENICLIDWSPPSSPSTNERPFGGSAFSSFSSSTSSLASSKKSFEYDPSSSPVNNANPWTPKTNHVQNSTFYFNSTNSKMGQTKIAPTIIRPQPPKPPKPSYLGKVRNGRERENLPVMPPSVPPPNPPEDTTDVVTPYGIALYDFPASQRGDLQLQADDVVILLRRVDNDWLYGQIEDREGIFPANFVDIRVHLPEDKNTVYALYDFRPQMTGDLELKAGQLVKVIRQVSSDWLYGECNNQRGQFPANYVDRII